jgi:hypothetical protein
MKTPTTPKLVWMVVMLAAAGSGFVQGTEEPAPGLPLVDLKASEAAGRFTVRDQQETVAASAAAETPGATGALGVVVTIKPGPDKYPGVSIKADGTPWDLSKYGYVEARLTNLGATARTYTLSLEGKEPGTSSVGNVHINPGKTETLRVYFGYQWGKPTGGFTPAAVYQALIFTGPVKEEAALRVEALTALGAAGDKPPVDPRTVRVKPPGGVILGGTADASKQLACKGAAKGSLAADGKELRIDFAGGKEESLTLGPAAGTWNLSDYLEVRVKIRNVGETPVMPAIQLESNSGPSDSVVAGAPMAPGTEAELVVPFRAKVPWQAAADAKQEVESGPGTWAGQPGTGTKYTSNFTQGIRIFSDPTPGAKSLEVTGIVADLPDEVLPPWLGTRPPVEGEWTKMRTISPATPST